VAANSLLRGAILAISFAGVLAMPPAIAQQKASATWSKAASLPHALDEQQAITVNGKIYLVGGAWDEKVEGKEDIEHYDSGFMTEYDPQTNQWRERSKGPEGLTHQGIAVLNGKIYLAGGFAAGHHTMPSPSVFSYDPATDKWQKLASLSDVRALSLSPPWAARFTPWAVVSWAKWEHFRCTRSMIRQPTSGTRRRLRRQPAITLRFSWLTARFT
jgi:N-acetylneuraminic acid mutarotase